MAGTFSEDETSVAAVAAALESVGLEAIIVGAAGAVLQGAPLATQDIDLLIRRSAANEKKIDALRARHPGSSRIELLENVHTLLLPGLAPLDLIFDAIPPSLKFASVRSRAMKLVLNGHSIWVASLGDIIESKAAADREKDRVHLVVLKQTLAARAKLAKKQ